MRKKLKILFILILLLVLIAGGFALGVYLADADFIDIFKIKFRILTAFLY